MIPRYSKMEFPTYDGTGDPLGWLRRCDRFFINQRIAEDKVGLASRLSFNRSGAIMIRSKKNPE
jgi:hypothetical protein